MKKLLILFFAVAVALPIMAQNKKPATINNQATTAKTQAPKADKTDKQEALPKVYDEQINAMEQIDQAIQEAQATGRKVICQVGGNWCPWCLRFANFITNDQEIATIIKKNYVYIHVNTSKANKNEEAMLRLGNPGRFGYPVFVILDKEGRVMQTQKSDYMELDKGYDRKKVLEFFLSWTDEAIDKIK